MKFLRRNWSKASRLGKGRKKKQIWRSPKGRHSKTRGERKGYPAIVKIGYKQEEKTRGLVEEKMPVLVFNSKDLAKMEKGQIAIIGNVGQKKRIEIAKKAKEKGIKISNLNAEKLLKKEEKKKKFKDAEKEKLKTVKEKKEEAKAEKETKKEEVKSSEEKK
jgi:large subunit ribosomal protein L32e